MFVHSYWTKSKKKYPKHLYWGRGNGWVIGAMPMLIDNLPNGKERDQAIQILQETSEALIKYQREDGYFESILNKPGYMPKESSATALIASGWMHAVREGYVDRKYLEPALKAFKAVVDDLEVIDGLLSMNHISAPTIPMQLIPLLGYKLQAKFQKGRDWTYGLAALNFAAVNYKKLIDEELIGE